MESVLIQVNGKTLPIKDDETHICIQCNHLSSMSATVEKRMIY